MREYGFSFVEALTLTPRRFWFLFNQIQRLKAEDLTLQMQVMVGSQASEEGREIVLASLQKQIGQVYVWTPTLLETVNLDETDEEGLDPEFDRAGLQALWARHRGQA